MPDVENLPGQMTLQEKVAMLAGTNDWYTVPVDTIERAAALAATSDVAIVCVGFGGDWQSEGFDRTDLVEQGERKTVTLSLGRDALAYYDDLAREWVAEAGEFEVLVGSSSQNIRSTAMFTLTTTSRWPS